MRGSLSKRFENQLATDAIKAATVMFLAKVREAGFRSSKWGFPKEAFDELTERVEPEVKAAIQALNGETAARKRFARDGVITGLIFRACAIGQDTAKLWIEEMDSVMFGEAA